MPLAIDGQDEQDWEILPEGLQEDKVVHGVTVGEAELLKGHALR
jgi:hypothetical protein